jgi:hypothetical protein
MKMRDGLKGAAAGLAGTVVLALFRAASQRWAPRTLPPIREDPGEFIVNRAERLLPQRARRQIPRPVEKAAAQGLALGYGITFGALYAVVHPRRGSRALRGATLGIGTWMVGYLGWLWLLGIMPPLWRQRALQAVAPAVQHVGYGLVTAGVHDLLQGHERRAA